MILISIQELTNTAHTSFKTDGEMFLLYVAETRDI